MTAAGSKNALEKRFRVFVYLSAFTLVLEVAGGFYTNSLALLSDAGHVLVDLLALLMAYAAIRFSQARPNQKYTYGYRRLEILSAVANGFILIFVTLYIFYESYTRLLEPQAVKGTEMLAIAFIGLAANAYVVYKMHSMDRTNLNVRGAYLHVLGDVLASISVIAAAFLISLTQNYAYDAIAGAIVGLFVLNGSYKLLKESARILMEGTPKGIDLAKLEEDIRKVEGVKQVHDLHAWSLSSDAHALSAHLLISAKDARKMNAIIREVNAAVKEKHGIAHTALQCECNECADEKHGH